MYVHSFHPYTIRPLNSLPAECFPLTYDLNGVNSKVNGQHLYLDSF